MKSRAFARRIVAGVSALFLFALTACALSACGPASTDPHSRSLAELDAFRGDNGLLSTVPADAFARAGFADTAYAVRLSRVLDDGDGADTVAPSADRWRQLWADDDDEPLWKAHTLCGAVGATEARDILAGEAAHLLREARSRASALATPREAALSLDVLAAVHVARCLGGDELDRPGRSAEQLLDAASSNAALTLQWVDVLTVAGERPLPVLVTSDYLDGEPPAACDDRTSLEAAALLVLTRLRGDRALERCAIADALDSDDPQVLLAAGRAARDAEPSARRADVLRDLERTLRERRGPDGTYLRAPIVSGSLNGTLAGVRLLTAGGDRLGADEASEVLATMTRHAHVETGDALLVLAVCVTLRGACDDVAPDGLRAAEALTSASSDDASTLDGLLGALALARPADRDRIDALVATLSARPLSPCARTQVTLFREVAATGEWPVGARDEARAAFRRAAAAADLTGYCDTSWAARLVSPAVAAAAPSRTAPPAHGTAAPLRVDGAGLLLWGDELAPLSVAAAAADLGLYERTRPHD